MPDSNVAYWYDAEYAAKLRAGPDILFEYGEIVKDDQGSCFRATICDLVLTLTYEDFCDETGIYPPGGDERGMLLLGIGIILKRFRADVRLTTGG